MNTYKVYYHKVPKEVSGHNNDKYYIGITSKKYISDRWGAKGGGYKTQIFYKAIKKYGWDNIEHKVLFDGLDAETAKLLEENLIIVLKSNNPDYGYNYTAGGDGIRDCDKRKCHPVYCKELNILFRTSEIASVFTGDNVHTISNCCRLKTKAKTLKYSYCFIEDMYKCYEKSKMSYCSKPVVLLSTGQIYGSCKIINKLLNMNFNRKYVLNYENYIKKKNSKKLYKRDYIMYAEDYVKIFDMTKSLN